MTRIVPVLTIDGPSGVGKGTVSQILAARLGWHYLDSGAVYRVLAAAVAEAGIDPADDAAVVACARALVLEFRVRPEAAAEVWLDGREVSAAIRTEECGNMASQLAVRPAVRDALLGLQRAQRRAPGLVAEGRDMGTVVFPDAGLKVYLDASPEVRAERRYKQLKEKGLDVNLPRLISGIGERDARDANRAVAPLRPAVDGYHVDSSTLSVDEVVARIWDRLHSADQTVS